MDDKRIKRHRRVRAKIKGTAKVPRLCVFRSNKHIYGQLIDDEKGVVLIAAGDRELKQKTKNKEQKTQAKNKKQEKPQKPLSAKLAIAYETGRLLAQKAAEKKIKKVIFDRAGYKYHGRVKSLAEGAREEG